SVRFREPAEAPRAVAMDDPLPRRDPDRAVAGGGDPAHVAVVAEVAGGDELQVAILEPARSLAARADPDRAVLRFRQAADVVGEKRGGGGRRLRPAELDAVEADEPGVGAD